VYDDGATSLIFSKNKHTIYGITVDKDKIKWLSANKKKLKFKLVKIENLIGSDSHKVYHYEMVKMHQLTEAHKDYLQYFVDIVSVAYSVHPRIYVSFIKHLKQFTRDEHLKKQLAKVYKVFKHDKKIELDIKVNQFRLLNGKIELIDPVYKHIYI